VLPDPNTVLRGFELFSSLLPLIIRSQTPPDSSSFFRPPDPGILRDRMTPSSPESSLFFLLVPLSFPVLAPLVSAAVTCIGLVRFVRSSLTSSHVVLVLFPHLRPTLSSTHHLNLSATFHVIYFLRERLPGLMSLMRTFYKYELGFPASPPALVASLYSVLNLPFRNQPVPRE